MPYFGLSTLFSAFVDEIVAIVQNVISLTLSRTLALLHIVPMEQSIVVNEPVATINIILYFKRFNSHCSEKVR